MQFLLFEIGFCYTTHVPPPSPPPPLAHLLTFTMAKKTNGTELPKPLCLFIGLIENVVQSELNRFPNWFPSIDMFIGGKATAIQGCFVGKGMLHFESRTSFILCTHTSEAAASKLVSSEIDESLRGTS